METDCGFPYDRQDIINIAQEYMRLNSKLSHLKLGTEWLKDLKKKIESQLTKRNPELLTQSRATALSCWK